MVVLSPVSAGLFLAYGFFQIDGSRNLPASLRFCVQPAAYVQPFLQPVEAKMHGLIYLIGLIVVIMAILSFFGLR